MSNWPEQYTTGDIRSAKRINEWLSQRGHTKTALARAAGISTGTVSRVLSGQWPSPPGEHLEAMSAALGRAEERDASPSEIPFTETVVSRTVHSVIERCHLDRDFGIFAGRVGIGKTMAARRYAEEHRGVAVLLEAYPGATAPVVLRLLCEQLGVSGARRTVADRTAALVEALRGGDRVIVIDEAETLTDQALLHLRRISDAAGVGVVLIGTPALLSLVYDPDGRFGQITSRIGLWPPVCQAITSEDAAALALAYLGEPPDADTQAAIWTACQGSARALRNVVRNTRRFCMKTGTRLSADAVNRVERTTMGGRRVAPA